MKKVLFLVALSLAVYGCSVEEMNKDVQEKNLEVSLDDYRCGDATTHYYENDLGEVEVSNDENYLYVKITSYTENALMNSRFAWATTFEDFGANPGTLPPGKMEQKMDEHGVTSFTFIKALEDITPDEDGCILIAAWSIFKANQGEHWAGDQTAGQTEWKYFKYCIQECVPPPPVIICESAFMYGTHTFYDWKNDDLETLNLDNRRWGWAYYYEGGNGVIKEIIYAGAGKNDTGKATEVGEVITTINGSDIEVQINIDPEFEDALEVVHIYLSNEAPTTNAPGQYGNTDDSPESGKVYNDFDDVNGSEPFWLIVHLELCNEE